MRFLEKILIIFSNHELDTIMALRPNKNLENGDLFWRLNF